MKTLTGWATILGVCLCWLTAGCDVKPGPTRTPLGIIYQVVSVDPDDPTELADVAAFEKARVNYEYRLEVLQGYYDRIGLMEKYRNTAKELKNLRTARWFKWEGAPEVIPPARESIDTADERMLVEYKVTAEKEYKDALAALQQHYQRKGQAEKARIMQDVAERLDPVRTYAYIPQAEIPPANLAPTEVIPAADALFDKALKMHLRAKILPLMPDYDKQREAVGVFRQMVDQYPSSTKIALAAYYIAEIYKEYFNENMRAVRWYERAWQWDPTIPKPARFQAAVIWDLRLSDPETALDLYKKVLEHEQFNQSNCSFAYKRIEEITRNRPPQSQP